MGLTKCAPPRKGIPLAGEATTRTGDVAKARDWAREAAATKGR